MSALPPSDPPLDDIASDAWGGDYDPLADPAERRVLFAALDSFRQYRRTSHALTTHPRRLALHALPPPHLALLARPPLSLPASLRAIDAALDENADTAAALLAAGLRAFNLPADPPQGSALDWRGAAGERDVRRAHAVLGQLWREWAAEGRREREASLGPVLDALSRLFPSAAGTKVLVPGAGLGRLVYELATRGFDAEGCEVGYHALVAGHWALNCARRVGEQRVYPFVGNFSNLRSRAQQVRGAGVPDVLAGGGKVEGGMRMVAGDFVVLYGGEERGGEFDAVATVFFVDTAPNVVRYVEAVRNCLRRGGVWVNLGPLLWHAREEVEEAEGEEKGDKGVGEPGGVELTEEEVFLLIEQMGFTVTERDETVRECGYIQDEESMLQHVYRPSHWVAVKK